MPKKKPSKTYYKNKADRIFSQMIRDRDRVCVANRERIDTCESPDWLQCAHIHTRSYSATRFDPDNAVTLCRSCHMYYTQRPLEFKVFIDLVLGENYYDRLGIRALAGAHRQHVIDWKAEAEEWEALWKSGTRLPKMSWTTQLGV